MVQCYKCNVTLSDWSTDSDPIRRHKSKSPECPLFLRQPFQRQVLLYHLLSSPLSKLFSRHYFQAIHTLFLLANSSDEEIDEAGDDIWSEVKESSQAPYISVRRQLLKTYRPAQIWRGSQIQQPLVDWGWFIRANNIVRWKNMQFSDPATLNNELRADWAALPQQDK